MGIQCHRRLLLLAAISIAAGCAPVDSYPTLRVASVSLFDAGRAVIVTGTSSTGSSTTGSSTSGTTGSGDNELSGALAFGVGKSIDLVNILPDGGEDPTSLGIDITDDSTDSCVDQEGYSDGGFPPLDTEDLILTISDPNGVQPNTPYSSLDAAQWATIAASGSYPSTAYAQVNLYDGTTQYVGVGGTVTVLSDPITQGFDANFDLSLQGLDPSSGLPTGSASRLSGNGTPAAHCVVGFSE